MNYSYQIHSFEEYQTAYKKSIEDPEGFWEEIATHFVWRKKWDTILNWNFTEPNIQWFAGAKFNITENCIDRHLALLGDKPALIWEPNNPSESHQIITYTELHQKVCQFGKVLKNRGVKKGDRVCIYMGMVPELAIAMLACARIGAIHSIIFGGFSAQSISERLQDAHIKYIITCDGAFRGQKEIPLKSVIDDALLNNNTVEKVIIFQRTHTPINLVAGRDLWWHEEIEKIKTTGTSELAPEIIDAEDPLFILYTSGSTGKPKGVVHAAGGYMVYTHYTFINAFQYKSGYIHFCTADIGWITGHSYTIYGPLSAGATTVLFEGIPTYPDPSRFWKIIDKFGINIFYTAPTAIRGLMTFGTEPIKDANLKTLKILGTVGEPINEEAWHWYSENIGKGNCQIIDTWWQTETGGILISNIAGITPQKPAWATLPLPGVQPILVDENGKEITQTSENISGNLCIKFPWPSIIRTTWGDHERCKKNYFSLYPNLYFTGDGAIKDTDGNYRITGRVDDVLNVSGHRIGTAEVENAINMHEQVVESAVVGFPHDIKGQGIYAYIILNKTIAHPDEVKNQIRATVVKVIGAIAKPDVIQFVSGLPKTRSGKIMRRILRKIAEKDIPNIGDTSTLIDPAVVEEIIKNSTT